MTSGKEIESLDCSDVNLIVGCLMLANVMKLSSSCCPCVQMRKISSMYLSQMRDLWVDDNRRFSSRQPIKGQTPEGAIRVPIAVPWIWI